MSSVRMGAKKCICFLPDMERVPYLAKKKNMIGQNSKPESMHRSNLRKGHYIIGTHLSISQKEEEVI